MIETASVLSMPLRPYQVEAARAIVHSVLRKRGLSFSVEIARQGGKNELSARIELLLLVRHMDRDVTLVKAAPTLRPQALISMQRLWSRVQESGLGRWAAKEEGHAVRLGRARQLFLSAEPASNVVGHTADLLLEVDEAQDVDPDKFDKEFRPMAAHTGATTVFYGTAWSENDLLERARQAHLEAERRDGIRRHFEYDWHAVAACDPAYGRYVAAEEERLGAQHPLFLTQYCLRTLPGAGRLFSPTQRSLLQGSHQPLDGPIAGETYVAGLDLAGEALDGASAHDSTVLAIARLRDADGPLATPAVEVVRSYAWTGAAHVELQGALVSLLRETWRVARVAVDATGLGEPTAAVLRKALGGSRVDAVKLTSETKSRLGYEMLAAVNSGGLRLPADDGTPEDLERWRQVERCQAVYRPNQTMGFWVDPRDGHDDHVVSLALAVAAAKGGGPRRARGRAGEDEGWMEA